MKKLNVINYTTAIIGASLIISSGCQNVICAGTTVAVSNESTIETSEYSDEPVAYYSDEEFDSYYKNLVDQYNKTGDNSSMQLLRQFIYEHCCSYSQLHTILEDGYFNDEIDNFKKSDVLEENYELPKGTKAIDTNIELQDPTEDEIANTGKDLQHDFSDFGEKTCDGILSLLCDNNDSDAYVTLPYGLEDKNMMSQLISIAAYNNETLTVNFAEDGNVKYKWDFQGIFAEGDTYSDKVNLNVDYANKSLSFDLGQNLPKCADLSIQTGYEEGTPVYLKNSSGNVTTLYVDEDGFITLSNITEKANYTISKGEVVKTDTGAENKDPDKASFLNVDIPSAIIMKILVIGFISLSIIFIVIGIIKSIKIKKKRH